MAFRTKTDKLSLWLQPIGPWAMTVNGFFTSTWSMTQLLRDTFTLKRISERGEHLMTPEKRSAWIRECGNEVAGFGVLGDHVVDEGVRKALCFGVSEGSATRFDRLA
jgi:hypothetical protein